MADSDLFQIPQGEEMEEYISHLTTEIRKQGTNKGVYRYEKPYNAARVDYFDCEVIIALLARMHLIPDPQGGSIVLDD